DRRSQIGSGINQRPVEVKNQVSEARHEQQKGHGGYPCPLLSCLEEILGGERGAAPTGAGGVGIQELESCIVQAVDVVEAGAVHILVADGVNKELHPILLDDYVIVAGIGVETQIILEPGAPAT